jgi:nitrate reductase cytochrome c-type subunit
MGFINKKILLFASILAFIGISVYVINKANLFEKEEITPLKNSWEKAIPNQAVPTGLVSLRAEDCGTCHKNHYEEWKLSTHAHAWTDLQFQAELRKESSPFMCINCHIPLQNQQEYIVKGLINGDIYKPAKEKNPLFDARFQKEGISCASCHVRNGAIIGSNGNLNAPHPVKKAPELLSENLCIGCHNANAVVTPTLACTFETGDEWKRGPFYGKKNCISCHLPNTERPLVEGFPKQKSHFHFFAGSGIPKFDTVKTMAQHGLAFYPQAFKNKITELDSLKFTLKVKNEFAGHRVPSGDPERFILIDFQLIDASKKVISSKKYRIGEEWQWYPVAKKLSDNNMNPSEERLYQFNSKLKKGNYQLKIVATKHRLTPETAAYNKLGDNYPLFIKFYEKDYEVNVNN